MRRGSSGRARAGQRLTLLSLLATGALAADPLESGPFRLEWSAPSGCPSGLDVLTRIEALLGLPVSEVLRAPLTARGRVRQTDGERFDLSLETFQAEQRFTREMQAPSCGELADAAALVLAIAVDPDLSERLSPGTAAAAPSASEPATPVPPATAAPAPAPEASAPNSPPSNRRPPVTPEVFVEPERKPSAVKLGFLGAAGVVADLGSVASFALGPALTFGLRFDAFELDVEGTWLPPRRSLVPENPEKGGDISLLTATLRPCGLLRGRPFEPGLCGALDLGDIWGTGFGTLSQTTRHSFWVAAGGSLFTRYSVSRRFALRLSAGLLFPLQATEFSLENVGTVYAVPDLVARFGFGVEAHLD
jgi:hypothetical protein